MKIKAPKKSYADRLMAGQGHLNRGGYKSPYGDVTVRANGNQNAVARLVGCVLRRDGVWHGMEGKYRSHSNVRQLLKDEDPYTQKDGDDYGFIDDSGNILTRRQASFVAVAAGQASQGYEGREILSSDIRW